MSSYAQLMKLILDGGTLLKPKEVTPSRLKVSGADAQYRNDRQLYVVPIEDVRNETSCVSRSLTLTADGRVAVPMLNPTDKEIFIRPGQPAFTELFDAKEKLGKGLDEKCEACVGSARRDSTV